MVNVQLSKEEQVWNQFYANKPQDELNKLSNRMLRMGLVFDKSDHSEFVQAVKDAQVLFGFKGKAVDGKWGGDTQTGYEDYTAKARIVMGKPQVKSPELAKAETPKVAEARPLNQPKYRDTSRTDETQMYALTYKLTSQEDGRVYFVTIKSPKDNLNERDLQKELHTLANVVEIKSGGEFGSAMTKDQWKTGPGKENFDISTKPFAKMYPVDFSK